MTRTIRIAFALVVIVTAMGRAQTPARDGAAALPPPTGTASLGGVVKDADNNPIRRAKVSIRGDMSLSRTTVTDDGGRFVFSELPQGRFTITASKAGFPEMSYGASRPNRAGAGVLLTEGQRVSGITLTLARGCVLTGTVYDDRGQPLPGVPVMAWEVRTALSGERTLQFATGGEAVTVTSDDHGRYRIYGLPPGEYTVGTAWFYHGGGLDVRVPTDAEIRAAFLAVTQSPGGAGPVAPPVPPPSSTRYDFTPVFTRNSLDPMAASTFTLEPGEERAGVDLQMQFKPMSSVEGDVTGPDGQPKQVELRLARNSSVNALNTTTVWGSNADGTFKSGPVPPGDHTLVAQLAATADQPALWASADLSVNGPDPVVVKLVLQPAMTVSGRVVFDGTAPPPDLSRVSVSLANLARNGPILGGRANKIEAAGGFSITGLIPGRFRLLASLSNPTSSTPAWTLASVTYGGRDVTDLPIDIAQGDAPSVTVTFTDRITELSGALLTSTGQPATGYFVVVVPADRQYWLLQSRRIVSARPDATGHYVFRGLPPGNYAIAATTDLVPADLQDPSALSAIAAQATPVSLTLGEKKTFDIKLGG